VYELSILPRAETIEVVGTAYTRLTEMRPAACSHPGTLSGKVTAGGPL
jgi:hypothetical protein